MHQSIESELHTLLSELVSGQYDLEEEAKIVAEAASIFKKAEKTDPRISLSHHAVYAQVREARMMDSLLQAMGTLDDWVTAEATGLVDGRGCYPDEIVRMAAKGEKFHLGDMDVDDNLLDAILDPDIDDPNDYFITDDIDSHDSSVFELPGVGRNRSDSQARA